MKLFAAILSVAAILVSCGPGSIITPPVGPGTEWPCGTQGQSCGNNMCCGLDDICGSNDPGSRCPAGYCCYDGPSWPMASRDPKSHPVRTNQWPEGASAH